MEKMNTAFRKIRRQGADASKNAATLMLIAELKSHTIASIELVPALAAPMVGKEKEKFIAGYREEMHELQREIEKLEAAVRADKNADVAAILESIVALQKKGHKVYRPKKS